MSPADVACWLGKEMASGPGVRAIAGILADAYERDLVVCVSNRRTKRYRLAQETLRAQAELITGDKDGSNVENQ